MTKDQNPEKHIQGGEKTQHGSLIGQYLLSFKLFSIAVNGREIFKNTAALMEILLIVKDVVCASP